MPPSAIDALLARANEEITTGRLPSCQLAIARHGELVTTATFGAATDSSRYVVFSVTKAVIAGAVWLLVVDGPLAPDTRVVDLIPEFGSNGKGGMTLEHLLAHTSGIARGPIKPEDGATAEGRLRRFAQWRLDWPPGTQTEYSTVTNHWVVAELIDRVAGDYRAFVTDHVLDPLGLTRFRLGVALEDQTDVVDVVLVGEGEPAAMEMPAGTTTENTYTLRFNEPFVREVGVPGAGAIGNAAAVALYYQALLHNPGGLWDPAVLADGTGHIRNSFIDPWIRVPANRTLGLVVAGDDGKSMLRQFGRSVGPRTFGAAGIGGQIAWADPDTGLSFCYLTNGIENDPVASFMRADALSTLAAACG